MKGLKKEKSNSAKTPGCHLIKLREVFSRPVVPDSSIATVEEKEEEELDIGTSPPSNEHVECLIVLLVSVN